MYIYVASGVMLINGGVYCVLGVCMLTPVRAVGKRHQTQWSRLGGWYPSMFKNYMSLLQPEPLRECTIPDDESRVEAGETDCAIETVEQFACKDLAFRLLAYLVFLIGFWRILAALFWACEYVFLGLGSCIAEIGIISLELLRHDSVMLPRTMLIMFLDVLLILIYLVPSLLFCL